MRPLPFQMISRSVLDYIIPNRELDAMSETRAAKKRDHELPGQTTWANGVRDCTSAAFTFSAINSRVPGNHMVHEQTNPVRHLLAEIDAVKR